MDHVRGQSAPGTQEREPISVRYFKVDSHKDDNSHLVRRYLWAAGEAAIVVPVIFYLRFGYINWFAIASTIFLVVLCLLVALGFFFQNRSAFHTNVPLANNIGDRIGAFWLVACTFGPFLGWVAMALPLTAGSWLWIYFARAFLAVVLPVITAIPLFRYAQGKAALVAIPLLVVITVLPGLSCWWVIGDLHDGSATTNIVLARDKTTGKLICNRPGIQYDLPCDAACMFPTNTATQVTWLPHTGRVIEVRKL